jgi:glycosyltransferase involved in cell wall biosynthesis
MPQITVVIPLYNKARFIGRALDSVLSQSFSDFEVIVVDDGSTDCGPDIVGQFADKRIRLIRQANSGPGAARNRGTKESNADLITYLDADDQWLSGFLSKSIEALLDHPQCDVVSSSYFIGARRIDRCKQLRSYGITQGVWSLRHGMERQRIVNVLGIFHSCSTIYKREVIEKYNGFYSKDGCSYGEDVYLWLQLIFNHKVFFNSEPLAWYHSEDSELGLTSGKSSYPIEPVLKEADTLKGNCPKEYHSLLDFWLANHALRAVYLNIELGDLQKAEWLLNAFPAIKKRIWQYFNIRFKINFPNLNSYLRRFKNHVKHFGSKNDFVSFKHLLTIYGKTSN